MVIRAVEGEARHPRVPDRVPPARRRVQALELPRRLAPPALPARPQPDAPVHAPGRDHARCSARSIALVVAAADRRLRPRVGPAHDDRRRAADDRRHAGRRARPLRARLRHVLHGREGPVVRPHARRASGSSTGCCSAARSLLAGLVDRRRSIVGIVDRPRLRRSCPRSGSRCSRRRSSSSASRSSSRRSCSRSSACAAAAEVPAPAAHPSAAALGLLVIAAAPSTGARRSASTSLALEPAVRPAAFVGRSSRGRARCARRRERVPAGTGARRAADRHVRAGRARALRLTVRSPGDGGGRARRARRRLARRATSSVPIAERRGADRDARRGLRRATTATRRIALAGAARDPASTRQVDGAPATARVRIAVRRAASAGRTGADRPRHGATGSRVRATRCRARSRCRCAALLALVRRPARSRSWCARAARVSASRRRARARRAQARRRARPPRRASRSPAAGSRWSRCLNAVAWGLIVPPFHVPDETAHFVYAQYLARDRRAAGQTPEHRLVLARTSGAVLAAQRFYDVIGRSRQPRAGARARTRPRCSAAQRPGVDRVGVGDAATATNNPPLYYLVQAVAYRAAHGADVTGRLARHAARVRADGGADGALRLPVPARAAAAAARSPWTVGGARRRAAADVRLHLLGREQRRRPVPRQRRAAARRSRACCRRGLTLAARGGGRRAARRSACSSRRRCSRSRPASALGAAAVRLARGGATGGAAALRRARGGRRRGVAPLAVYGVLGATVWDRPLVDRVAGVTSARAPADVAAVARWREQLSYPWQLYLPRAAVLDDLLPGVPPYDAVVQGPRRALRLARLRLPGVGLPRRRGRLSLVVAALAGSSRCGSAATRCARARASWSSYAVDRGRAGRRRSRVAGYRRGRSTARRLRAGALPAAAAAALRARSPRSPCGALGRRWRARSSRSLLVAGVVGHGLLAQLHDAHALLRLSGPVVGRDPRPRRRAAPARGAGAVRAQRTRRARSRSSSSTRARRTARSSWRARSARGSWRSRPRRSRTAARATC